MSEIKLTKSIEDFILSHDISGYKVKSIDNIEESFSNDTYCVELTVKDIDTCRFFEHCIWIKKEYVNEDIYKYFKYQELKNRPWMFEIVPMDIGEFTLDVI